MNGTSIRALIMLTHDPDPHVRDWATMSLGTQSDQDSTEIRAALRARLDDDDADDTATTGEAAIGLARREDRSVLPYLQRWLSAEAEMVGNLVIEAAGELGDSQLLPRLLELKKAGWQDHDPRPEVLDDAISALTGIARSDEDDAVIAFVRWLLSEYQAELSEPCQSRVMELLENDEANEALITITWELASVGMGIPEETRAKIGEMVGDPNDLPWFRQ